MKAGELILRRECPVCETDEATAADMVQEGESVTCQACRAPLVAVDGVDMTLEVQEDLLSAAYRHLHGEVEHLRSQAADVARWLGCGPAVGEVEARCKALRPVEYRPGLPTVEQVQAHHARGGWWQFLYEGEEGPCMVRLRWEDHDGDSSLIVGRHAGRIEFSRVSPPASCRPVAFPDGTPCPWPEKS